MGRKFKIDDTEYDTDNITENARTALTGLKFAEDRLRELNDLRAVMQRSKNSYIESIKREMLSDKSGFLLSDD